jgi:hypothetical protein
MVVSNVRRSTQVRVVDGVDVSVKGREDHCY